MKLGETQDSRQGLPRWRTKATTLCSFHVQSSSVVLEFKRAAAESCIVVLGPKVREWGVGTKRPSDSRVSFMLLL